jgi:tetrahydromethanopterin S-methyltransferase subunit F
MPDENAQKITIINIRLDAAMLQRIDEQVERMRERVPYFSRNQMINLLLIRGLEHTEDGTNYGLYESQ